METSNRELSPKTLEDKKVEAQNESKDNTEVESKESDDKCTIQETQDGCEEETKKEVATVDTEQVSKDTEQVSKDTEQVSKDVVSEEKAIDKTTEEDAETTIKEAQGSFSTEMTTQRSVSRENSEETTSQT